MYSSLEGMSLCVIVPMQFVVSAGIGGRAVSEVSAGRDFFWVVLRPLPWQRWV